MIEVGIRILVFLATTCFFIYSVVGERSKLVTYLGGTILILGLYFSLTSWSRVSEVFRRRKN